MRWMTSSCLTLGLVLASAANVQAELITYEFEGVITSQTSVVQWFAGVGDTFSGRFTYDTTTPNTSDGVFPKYEYRNFDTPPSPIEFDVVLNGVAITAFDQLVFTETTFPVGTKNLGVVSSRVSTPNPVSPLIDNIALILSDPSGTASFGFGQVVPTPFSLSNFNIDDSGFSVTGANNSPTLTGRLTRLQFVSSNPVPEPSSILLLTIGAIGLVGYDWRRRRKSSSPNYHDLERQCLQ